MDFFSLSPLECEKISHQNQKAVLSQPCLSTTHFHIYGGGKKILCTNLQLLLERSES
uniref:Uncharacterized protein n=1 Tax=Rhizophora mucronata TaxID=61149 RepID=A0A2P2NB00_RHIMU